MKSKTRAKTKRIAIPAFLLSTIIGIGIMAGIRGKPDSLSKAASSSLSKGSLENQVYKKVMMTDDYLLKA